MTTRETHTADATTQNQPATPGVSPRTGRALAPPPASPTPPPDPNTALEAYAQQTVAGASHAHETR